jgi:Uma2 family endonuclease
VLSRSRDGKCYNDDEMTATFAPVPRYAPTSLPVRLFSVGEYHRLIADGYFASDERFELLEGLIVQKMPRDPIHDAALMIAEELLRARLPEGWRVRVQSAITTGDSEAEPDLVIVRGQPRDYLTRHPGPQDLAAVIEIANTTLHDDRTIKQRVYARAGIRTYWIINLINRRIEVYEDPVGDPAPTYRRHTDFEVGTSIPLTIGTAGVPPIPVGELLP